MAAKEIKEYKNRAKYTYPSDNINPGLKKDAKYALMFMQALMADFASGNTHVPFEFGSAYSYETLRRYATGKEGNSMVKKNFFGEQKRDKATGKYPTTVNTSWNGTDVMPKFFDVMRSVNQKIEYRTTARAIDSDSTLTKQMDRAYAKFLIEEKARETFAMAKFKPSSPVNIEEIGAQTESDIDLFFDSGAYVTQREIAATACTQKTNKESNYKVIQDMQFDDIITIGIFAGKNYIDKANNIVKKRYVDPANCIIPYSKHLDFRNIDKFGEFREMTIGELREEFPQIPAYQWKVIAREYANQNPEHWAELSRIGIFSQETATTYGDGLINGFRVKVLDAQWLSMDTENRLTNDKNNDFYKEVEYGYEVKGNRKRTGDKVIAKNYLKKYYATWIVGTDIILDNGVCEDLVYYGKDGNKIVKLDYFCAKTGNKSLVERCIQHIEDIHLAVVKLRNAIATIPPAPRMIIQQQLMDNVFLNGKRVEPEDNYQKFIEKGLLTVNNLDAFNKPIFQNSKAIEFVPANAIDDIQIFRSEIIAGVEAIREVTGLNQAADASTPNPYVGLGKSQMAAAAANNALSPSFNAFVGFVKDSDEDVVKKWQIVAKRVEDLEIEHAPLGINTMQVLKLGKYFTNSDFNIYTEMEFTQEEMQNLFQQILELNKNYVNTQGASGLNTAEFMHLQEMIMAGNFQMAKYVIARTEKKRELMAMRFKRESEQFTFQAQQQSAMLANRMKQEAISDEEREKLLTVRISEIEKRITKMYESITAADMSTDPTAPPTGVMALIAMQEQAITQLIAQNEQIKMAKAQQQMQGGQNVA